MRKSYIQRGFMWGKYVRIRGFAWLCVLLVLSGTSLRAADILVPLSDDVRSSEFSTTSHEQTSIAQEDSNESESPKKPKSVVVRMLNGQLIQSDFGISLHGVGLELNAVKYNSHEVDIFFSAGLNFASVSLTPKGSSAKRHASIVGYAPDSETRLGASSQSPIKSEHAFILGGLAQLDVLFSQSHRGYHALGLELGFSLGLPSFAKGAASHSEQFMEQSMLLNADYGYAFVYGGYTLLPFVRLEGYGFGSLTRARSVEGGFNAVVGVKNIWDTPLFEYALNVGALSDLNLSGNGVGVLGNGVIVYDKGGMSNGVFGEMSISAFEYKGFQLFARTNCSYMLSYYEINLATDIAVMYRF